MNSFNLPISPRESLLVPGEVSQRGDMIVWNWTGSSAQNGDWERESCEGVLGDFTQLAAIQGSEGSANLILAFAERYGPLLLCQHGMPLPHASRWAGMEALHGPSMPGHAVESVTHAVRVGRLYPEFRRTLQPEGTEPCRPGHEEPIETWVLWAKKVKALFEVGMKLRDGKMLLKQDFQAFTAIKRDGMLGQLRRNPQWLTGIGSSSEGGEITPLRHPVSISTEEERRELFQREVQQLIHLAGFQVLFSHRSGLADAGRLVLDGVGVFSRIVVELLQALHNPKTTICHECGRVFVPEGRKRPVGQRHFCNEHRSARFKHAQRDARANPSE